MGIFYGFSFVFIRSYGSTYYFYIVGFGILVKTSGIDDFLAGWQRRELGTVVQVVPSLVGLMTAVGVLRHQDF